MPEYVLPERDEPAFRVLPDFVQGYIEAMFFTNASCIPMVEFHTEESQHRVREGQADGDLPQDAGFLDLHPDALAEIERDCAAFITKAEKPLADAYEAGTRVRGCPQNYGESDAGRDFWFTRNGHGVGFWDRELGETGDQLSAIAEKFGEVNPWFTEPDPTSPTGHGWVQLS